MYDTDDTPTADSAQQWLNFLSFWSEEHWNMIDRFLRDFSAVWHGEPDARPPEQLHTESLTLKRKHQKDDSAGSLGGTTAYQFSNDGRLTLIQAGRQHLELAPDEQEALRLLLNARPLPAKPQVVDINTQNVFPPTNAQMSANQNELTLKYLKQRR